MHQGIFSLYLYVNSSAIPIAVPAEIAVDEELRTELF
jgi:hypothetical protein